MGVIALEEAILDLSLGISKIPIPSLELEENVSEPEDRDEPTQDHDVVSMTRSMLVEPRVEGLCLLLHRCLGYRCNSSCALCTTLLLISSLMAGIITSVHTITCLCVYISSCCSYWWH